jgi:hypothetical protein
MPNQFSKGLSKDFVLIASDDDLLLPRFYLAESLEGWLPETLKKWATNRPQWTIPEY